MAAVAIDHRMRIMDSEIQNNALRALECGDRKQALTIIMQSYGKELYRYCHKMLGDAALAEDAHQETFVSAYKSLDKYSGRSTLRAWLYGIAFHRCLDTQKKTRRKLEYSVSENELPREQNSVQEPDKRCEHQEITKLMEECLQKLPQKIRNAVLLRYMKDFSYQEMEQICFERAATLQARVARALPVLRRCIESKGGNL